MDGGEGAAETEFDHRGEALANNKGRVETEDGRRGLADGDRVRLYNELGEVGLVLRVSDEIRPGVVLVPGQRPDSETISGTVNMLVSDRYTDLGEGATYQSTFLEVEAWPGR